MSHTKGFNSDNIIPRRPAPIKRPAATSIVGRRDNCRHISRRVNARRRPACHGTHVHGPRGFRRKLDKFEIKPLSLKASTPPPPPTVASVSCYDAQATFYLISPSSRFIDAHIFPNFLPEGCKGAVQPSTSSFMVLALFSLVNNKV